MSTKQEQIEAFKEKKALYDSASTKEEKTSIVNQLNSQAQTSDTTPRFSATSDLQNAQSNVAKIYSNYEDVVSNQKIIDSKTWSNLNSTFSTPSAVKEADTYLKSQLQKIQSGKTSYSDQVRDMITQIQDRDKFTYDADADPLFQQALSSAMNSGKQAMQDTMGQASALTGGYGSTYATTAANQAYSAFIEDAYDNLPQYYQMAMEAYQMEGDEMYRQLGILSDADAQEYERMLGAYDATSQYRNQIYNEAYSQFRDAKNDAYNVAQLGLSEYSQRANDALNMYNVASDYANTLYAREYGEWMDQINLSMKEAEIAYNQMWDQKNFDRSVYESNRNYKREVDEYNDSRYWDNYWKQNDAAYRDAALADERYWSNYWNRKDLEYKNATLDEDKRKFNVSMGDTNNDGVVSDAEYAKYVERYGSKEGAKEKTYPKTITDRISTMSSNDDIAYYLANQVTSGIISQEDAEELASLYSVPKYASRKWTMSYDGGNNGNGGIDKDARVKDEYGREITLDELVNELVKEGMSQDDATDYVLKLQKNLGITKN